MDFLALQIPKLLQTWLFFTRISLPAWLVGKVDHDAPLNRSAHLFAITGFLIGLIPAIVWAIASLFLPAHLAAGIAILTGVLATGALHEDGLSDCADGLGGGQTRERALEIMKDSRIGAFGAVALILTIGLRWAALASLDPLSGFLAIVIAHSFARSAMAIPIAHSSYARPEGLASTVSQGIDNQALALALGSAAIIAILLGGTAAIIAIIVAGIFAYLLCRYLERRIGGYTGDGLGAIEQICEIVVMIILAGYWSGL